MFAFPSPTGSSTRQTKMDDEKEIRQSLLFAVGSVCDDTTHKQFQERAAGQRQRPAPSKEALALLADMLHNEIEIVATELQHFAHHANRKVVKPEDVLLLARKDPVMVRSLQKYQREQLGGTTTGKRRR